MGDSQNSVDVWRYIDEQPDPPDVSSSWLGARPASEGESETLPGEAWHSGDGHVNRTWTNIDLMVQVEYAILPSQSDILVSRLEEFERPSDVSRYDSDGELLKRFSVPNGWDSIRQYDDLAMGVTESVIARAEAGEL